MSPRLFFRTVAIAEAVTWTLLIAGMMLKYVLQAGDLGVRIGGFLHGLVFLAYAMTAVLVAVNQRWSSRLTGIAVVTAVIPYATIPFDVWLDRHRMLEGPWRRTASDHPSDSTWPSRLLRWMLNRPALLVTSFVFALAAIMTVLLLLGPPGGRD